jgi:hypothetical protein
MAAKLARFFAILFRPCWHLPKERMGPFWGGGEPYEVCRGCGGRLPYAAREILGSSRR